MFRISSSTMRTYRYGVYEFEEYIENLEVNNQGDYQDKADEMDLDISTSLLEHLDRFGCEETSTNDLWLCKAY